MGLSTSLDLSMAVTTSYFHTNNQIIVQSCLYISASLFTTFLVVWSLLRTSSSTHLICHRVSLTTVVLVCLGFGSDVFTDAQLVDGRYLAAIWWWMALIPKVLVCKAWWLDTEAFFKFPVFSSELCTAFPLGHRDGRRSQSSVSLINVYISTCLCHEYQFGNNFHRLVHPLISAVVFDLNVDSSASSEECCC